MKTLFLAVMIAIVCVVDARPGSAGDDPIVTTDLLNLRSVTSVDVSEDGTLAVYAVHSIAKGATAQWVDDRYTQATYAYQSHLFMLDLTDRNATPVQLTHGERNDSSPHIAPDNRSIAFVRAGADGAAESSANDEPRQQSQVWVLPLGGGEARQITNFKHGVTDPQWSPIGDALLVGSTIPLDDLDGRPKWNGERPGRAWNDIAVDAEGTKVDPDPAGSREQIRAWLALNESVDNPSAINRIDFHSERGLRRPYRFRHLFLIDPATAEPQTMGDATRVTHRFADHQSGTFMPDGEHVVYSARTSEEAHIDRIRESGLYMVGVDGTDDHPLLAREGWSFSNPKPSRDGSVIAFTARMLDDPGYRPSVIGMIPAHPDADEQPIMLTDTFDRSVRSFQWMSARGSILFTVADQGSVPMFQISSGLLEPAAVIDGAIGVGAFDVGGGAIVWEQTAPDNPSVLMVRTATDGDRIAHDLNPWVHEKALSFPTAGWIDRPDKTRVQYWIMPPTVRNDEDTHPLCLEIHGGPSAMWGPGEATMWLEFQLLCSWGYGVVYSNPRGSGGYGYDFQRANYQNWGSGPTGDVLAAVDRALAEEWVDPDRLVVTGGSYAGYLTAWLVTNDHRFKAAVAQRGVYDLTTFFGEGNAWRLVEYHMGGRPWDSNIKPILERESPFWHARQIRTPLLIMHSSNDRRTGVSQSEMLYRALKVLERPVEYVRYPDAGHDLSRTGDPLQRMDRLNRIIEFFERHIINRAPAPHIPD